MLPEERFDCEETAADNHEISFHDTAGSHNEDVRLVYSVLVVKMGKMRTDIHIAGVTTTQVWSKSVKRGFNVTRRITLVTKVLYPTVRC